MKKFLCIVSVGLIVTHIHAADRRGNRAADSRWKNVLAQSQQLNRQRQSEEQSNNPLAQSQVIARAPSSRRYSEMNSLTASTPLPMSFKTEPLMLAHPLFYPGPGYVLSDAFSTKYRKDNDVYMLFCAQKHGGDWRIGYISCRAGDVAAFQTNPSPFVVFFGDLFSCDEVFFSKKVLSINRERCKEYGVSKFDTQNEALQFIRSNSTRFFSELFKEIDKAREVSTTTTKSEEKTTNTTDI